MAWTFRCDSPDFKVRSAPDDVQFDVQRKCLEDGSEIFRDMFSCCSTEDSDQIMDLSEGAEALTVLLRLLHDPPQTYVSSGASTLAKAHEDAIPLPILRIAFDLSDKYMLSPQLSVALHTHLAAHATTSPLKVYGYATALGLEKLASLASEHLLHPPVASYTLDEISVIPTVAALHNLVVLQGLREPRLRDVLLREPLFPHSYGMCASHGKRVIASWEERKKALAPKVRAGTDVAAEMAGILAEVEACDTCTRAATAAVDMLAYKCRKVIHKVSQLQAGRHA